MIPALLVAMVGLIATVWGANSDSSVSLVLGGALVTGAVVLAYRAGGRKR